MSLDSEAVIFFLGILILAVFAIGLFRLLGFKNKNLLLDSELVASLCGKTLFVGITYCDIDGTPIDSKQFYGIIEDISEKGVFIRHPNTGKTLLLPPDLSVYKKASAGEYRLESGEIIINPDLIGQWTAIKNRDYMGATICAFSFLVTVLIDT